MQVGRWSVPENMDLYESWFIRDGRISYYDIDTWVICVVDLISGQVLSVSWELSEENLQIEPEGICWGDRWSGGLLFIVDEITGKAKLGLLEVAGVAIEL